MKSPNLFKVDGTGRITHAARIAKDYGTARWEVVPRKGLIDTINDIECAVFCHDSLTNWDCWTREMEPTIDEEEFHRAERLDIAHDLIEAITRFPRFVTPGGTVIVGGLEFIKKNKPKGCKTPYQHVVCLLPDLGYNGSLQYFTRYILWLGSETGNTDSARALTDAVVKLADAAKECGIDELETVEDFRIQAQKRLDEFTNAVADPTQDNRQADATTAPRTDITTPTNATPPPVNIKARANVIELVDKFRAGDLDTDIGVAIKKRKTLSSFFDYCGNMPVYTNSQGIPQTVNDCVPGGEDQLGDWLHTRSQEKHAAKKYSKE